LKNNNNLLTSVGAIVVAGVILFFSPLIGLVVGWFAGWVISLFAGDFIANGLNLLFNTTRFTSDAIPMLTATFAVFGSYFKSSQTNKSK
jgi:hypothetical protein